MERVSGFVASALSASVDVAVAAALALPFVAAALLIHWLIGAVL